MHTHIGIENQRSYGSCIISFSFFQLLNISVTNKLTNERIHERIVGVSGQKLIKLVWNADSLSSLGNCYFILKRQWSRSQFLFFPCFRTFPQPEEMAQIARIRWPRDVRRDNVRAMLDSTKPVLIATQHLYDSVYFFQNFLYLSRCFLTCTCSSNVRMQMFSDAGTDGEIREAQEQFLSATWTRYLSQAFGRAFFELR